MIHTPDPVCCEVVLQLKGKVLQGYLALHGPAGSCLHITKLYQFLYQLRLKGRATHHSSLEGGHMTHT